MKTLEHNALDYHAIGKPGKIAIEVTKAVATQGDLALAYSPGVAAPCIEINKNPAKAYEYTAKGNLVGVITNGTAVLGLGDIGALAGKPVMEGKSVLFKKFAGIDAFDIEIDETDPEKLVEIIAALHPTFGGINLEDIKAPECFFVERHLRDRLSIPVFHDDQHGTAIVVGAGFLNAMELTGRDISKVKLVCSGAGAAAMACLDLLLDLGVQRENVFVCDSRGVLTTHRELTAEKRAWAQNTDAKTLSDIIHMADVFLGVSGPGSLSQDDVKKMAAKPIVFALANPEPELRPELVREVASDAIVPESDQQRAVLPIPVPRSAGLCRHQHQPADEACLRRSAGGNGAQRRALRTRLHRPDAARQAPLDRGDAEDRSCCAKQRRGTQAFERSGVSRAVGSVGKDLAVMRLLTPRVSTSSGGRCDTRPPFFIGLCRRPASCA